MVATWRDRETIGAHYSQVRGLPRPGANRAPRMAQLPGQSAAAETRARSPRRRRLAASPQPELLFPSRLTERQTEELERRRLGAAPGEPIGWVGRDRSLCRTLPVGMEIGRSPERPHPAHPIEWQERGVPAI